MLPDFPVEGGCQCGAVRYVLTARPLAVYNCHCKDCQRFSGAMHSMSMVARRSDVQLLQGELGRFEKQADSGRIAAMRHCPHCGTKVWNEPLSAPDLVILKPGTLDDMSWAVPAGNIWTASRAPFVEIDEALINFEGQPPSRDVFYSAWERLAVG